MIKANKDTTNSSEIFIDEYNNKRMIKNSQSPSKSKIRSNVQLQKNNDMLNMSRSKTKISDRNQNQRRVPDNEGESI